jgi:hypothetical protein
MTIRPTLPLLALLALGCAPSVTPIPPGAIERESSRYRLVLDPASSEGGTSGAVARMGIAIEEALAERGMLRAAEWEEAPLTVRFALMELVDDRLVSPTGAPNFDQRAWDRSADQACTTGNCSMAYWTPLVFAPVPASSRSSRIAIRIETAGGERTIWSGARLEQAGWSRIGQRRANEIARELVRALPATFDS